MAAAGGEAVADPVYNLAAPGAGVTGEEVRQVDPDLRASLDALQSMNPHQITVGQACSLLQNAASKHRLQLLMTCDLFKRACWGQSVKRLAELLSWVMEARLHPDSILTSRNFQDLLLSDVAAAAAEASETEDDLGIGYLAPGHDFTGTCGHELCAALQPAVQLCQQACAGRVDDMGLSSSELLALAQPLLAANASVGEKRKRGPAAQPKVSELLGLIEALRNACGITVSPGDSDRYCEFSALWDTWLDEHEFVTKYTTS